MCAFKSARVVAVSWPSMRLLMYLAPLSSLPVGAVAAAQPHPAAHFGASFTAINDANRGNRTRGVGGTMMAYQETRSPEDSRSMQ